MRLAIRKQAQAYGPRLKDPSDITTASDIVRQAFPTGLGAGLMQLASREGLTMRQVAFRALRRELAMAGVELEDEDADG
jgi:hypothetical protein